MVIVIVSRIQDGRYILDTNTMKINPAFILHFTTESSPHAKKGLKAHTLCLHIKRVWILSESI